MIPGRDINTRYRRMVFTLAVSIVVLVGCDASSSGQVLNTTDINDPPAKVDTIAAVTDVAVRVGALNLSELNLSLIHI